MTHGHTTGNPDDGFHVEKPRPDQNRDQAKEMIEKARQAEQEADPSKMSAEDRALYYYLQSAVLLLESEYDIKLDDTSRP